MIVVIDQFRPDYVERFDMANVRALMDGGVNFQRALLGHMAAETVITHNVLTSGVLPKHKGWVDEVYRDVDGVLGPAGSYQVTFEPRLRPVRDAAEGAGLPEARRPARRPKFISVGQKTTAACTAGHPADADDIIVHIGSRNRDCDGDGANNWRGPAALNIPTTSRRRSAAATTSTSTARLD